MKSLNSITCPLDTLNLIEASAGTGKTYNIQNLFARLIIEKNYTVNSILVVTFTEAATKELKDRIRKILNDLLVFLETGTVQSDQKERIEKLSERFSTPDIYKRKHIIKNALSNFDEASIYTIHGFCSKMLNQCAFETSSLFNTTLENNPNTMIREIIEDYWRTNFYKIDILTKIVFEYKKITIDKLYNFIIKILQKQGLKLIPSKISPINFQNLSEIYQRLKEEWDFNEIISILNGAKLNQATYKPVKIQKAAENMEYFLNGKFNSDFFSSIDLFTLKKINSKKTAKSNDINHEFFSICDEFLNIINMIPAFINLQCHEYFKTKYKEKKDRQNLITFDDLLINLDNNLNSKEAGTLINNIRGMYNAVLIDEFQDTDPVQYSIFRKIFIDGNKTTFLVGDPKQAIYGFRGADVYTYKKAKEELQNKKGHTYTIDKNFRSIPNLVNGVNSLFSEKEPGVFVNDFINFHSIKAKDFDPQNDLTKNGKQETAPIKILFNENAQKNPEFNIFAFQQTSNEIYKLLTNSELKVGKEQRNVLPQDIAILVSNHAQAANLQPYLRELNIPVVLQASGNIFDTPEANNIALMLSAIADPGNAPIIKGLLTSDLFSITSTDLHSFLENDSEIFEKLVELFRTAHEIWVKGSFIEMFNFFISENKINEYLLTQEQGERKLTNYLHLAELIEQQEMENRLNISALISWYQKQQNPKTRDEQENYEIRLESDTQAVQIMTVHKSKGLEFPIVFCPFLGSRKPSSKSSIFEYHNSLGDFILDFSGENINKSQANDEYLEELMRMVYVAITRAKYQCYIFWGNTTSNISSALTYLFHRDTLYNDKKISQIGKGNIVDALSKKFNKKPIDMIPDSSKLSEQIELITEFDDYDETKKYETMETIPFINVRKFKGEIDKIWRISSFSNLSTEDKSIVPEIPIDYDDIEENEKVIDTKINIFNFPAGVKTGNCFHSIFEEIDFTTSEEKIKNIIKEKLVYFQLNADDEKSNTETLDLVYKMVENVLKVDLSPKIPGLRLEKISKQDRLTEVEFNIPIHHNQSKITFPDILKNSKYNIKINDDIFQGFMTGFIDLVIRYKGKFYIIDWKSNRLSGNKNDFEEKNIIREMHKHNYNLQYLIYTTALNIYLKSQIPNYDYKKHFGGIFYVFLRGVEHNKAGKSIYFDKPEEQIIHNITQYWEGKIA